MKKEIKAKKESESLLNYKIIHAKKQVLIKKESMNKKIKIKDNERF